MRSIVLDVFNSQSGQPPLKDVLLTKPKTIEYEKFVLQ